MNYSEFQIIKQLADVGERLSSIDTLELTPCALGGDIAAEIAKAEILPAIKMKKISPAALQKGAGIIDKLKKKHKAAVGDSVKRNKQKANCGLYDDEYDKALQYLDEEDLPTGLEWVEIMAYGQPRKNRDE